MLNAVIESSAESYKYDQELDVNQTMVLFQAHTFLYCSYVISCCSNSVSYFISDSSCE